MPFKWRLIRGYIYIYIYICGTTTWVVCWSCKTKLSVNFNELFMVWSNLHEPGILSWALFLLIGASLQADTSMFTYNSFMGSLIILVYVDDILVTGSNFVLISTLNDQFALKDLGDIHYFLGLQAYQNGSCLHLCQTKYIQNLLIWTSMQASNPLSSPMFSIHPLSLHDGAFIIWSFCVQKCCWNTPVLRFY